MKTNIKSLFSLSLIVMLSFSAFAEGQGKDKKSKKKKKGEESPEAFYNEKIKPLMDTYCYYCHGEEKQKAGVRLDTLGYDFSNKDHAFEWKYASKLINSNEMPPSSKPQFTAEEKELLMNWITKSLEEAKAKEAGE